MRKPNFFGYQNTTKKYPFRFKLYLAKYGDMNKYDQQVIIYIFWSYINQIISYNMSAGEYFTIFTHV